MSATPTKGHVLSNAVAHFHGRVPAAILYPSLGAPTCVSDKGFLHLLLLADGTEDSLKKDVDQRLRIFKEYQDIQDIRGQLHVVGLAGSLVATLDAIKVEEKDPKARIEIDDIGLRGYLAESVLRSYQSDSREEDPRGIPSRKKDREADSKAYSKLWHVAIDLSKLVSTLEDGGKPSPSRFRGGEIPELLKKGDGRSRRYFLHWLSRHDNPKGAQAQEETVDRILTSVINAGKTAEDIPRMGSRLGKELVRSPNGDGSLPPLRPGWNLGKMTKDESTPLTTYHPFYLHPPRHSNVGFLSDLHLVTKFRLLRHSDVRVVPGETDETNEAWKLVPTVGSQVVDTVETLREHFQNLRKPRQSQRSAAADGAQADLVVIGGDLVDFFADLFPESKDAQSWMRLPTPPQSKPGDPPRFPKIWDACGISHVKSTRDKNYQEGSGTLGFYQMVAEFVTRCEKPVFLLAGNHDAYKKPFGISPRLDFVGIGKLEMSKANAGIPIDSNLTILEACLAFGPSFETWLDSNDFEPIVMELYYLLYSPFRTWTTQWGGQQLLHLDWGPNESMFLMEEGSDRLGHLPHANEALEERDLGIVDWAVSQHRPVLCFSHFTWACYKETVPIVPEGTVGGFATVGKSDVTKYNIGTCRKGRDHMFRLFHENKIHVAISGHAHRAAVYGLTGGTVHGIHHKDFDGDYACVTGWHFDDFLKRGHLKEFRDKTLLVVSDSAGPLPRENRGDMVYRRNLDSSEAYKGEWGSRPPSWTLVQFDPHDGKVIDLRSVYASNPKAKPRLAATLDYLEVFHAKDAANLPSDVQKFGAVEAYLSPLKSEPLWQVPQKAISNLQAWDDQCIRPFDPDQDRFYTNIFSALISEPIGNKCLKRDESGIRFFFNSGAIPFPGGCPIAGLDILWKDKDGHLQHMHLDRSHPNATYLIVSSSKDIETIIGWSNRRPIIQKTIWFSWNLSTSDGAYATDSPWILWGKAGIIENKKFSQIHFRRDLTPNERPDLNIYTHPDQK